MAIAISALRSSVSASSGVPAVKPSVLVDSTMSAPGRTPASRSSSRTGQPVQIALPLRSPPTSLDTHISVTIASCMGLDCSVSQSISTVRSTIPCTRSRHVAGSTCGTTSAVSMR